MSIAWSWGDPSGLTRHEHADCPLCQAPDASHTKIVVDGVRGKQCRECGATFPIHTAPRGAA